MTPQYQGLSSAPEGPARPPGGYRPERDPDAGPNLTAVRIVAVLAVLLWWLFMYGLIDLSTPFGAVPADLQFYDVYMLEGGWGLLYTVLLGVPAVALLWRPASPHPAVQHVVVGAALALAAVATPELGHLLPAAAAIGLGLGVLTITAGGPRWPSGYLRSPRGLWWVPAAVAAAAVVPAVGYALECLDAARAGVPGDDTNGLDHWPAQGAFAVAVVLVAAHAVLARGGRVPAWCAAVSAAWFGALSWTYPDHLASAGTTGGVAAMAWAVAYIAVWEVVRRRAVRRDRRAPALGGAA